MKDLYIITERTEKNYEKKMITTTMEEIKDKYVHKNIKVDRIIELIKVSSKDLSKIIELNTRTRFPYGLLIDNNFILCEEITLYSIIDYENKCINIENLNKYFLEKNKKIRAIIEFVTIFSVESIYFSDEEITLDYCNGLHICNRLEKKELPTIIKNSATKLLNMGYPSGKFIYHINALTGEYELSYNVLRHAGSIWSLVYAKDYIDDQKSQKKIDKYIDYMINNYITIKGNKAFLSRNLKRTGFSLGANALMLLSLAEYQIKFKKTKYEDIAIKLANGILSMQQPSGQYYQAWGTDLELVEIFDCEYYVGEAMLALIRTYTATKKQEYLDSVVEALDYYISTGFDKYSDHWIAYTLAELSGYVQNEKIIEFAIKNVSPIQRTRFNPTKLEANMQLYKFYYNMKKHEQFAEKLEEYPIEQVKSNIEFYLKMLMSYYIDDEVAIYTKDMDKSKYGFFCPTDNNRMRIDDIQHSIVGIINYYEHYNENM